MELLVTLDALKRGSARRITAVIPYYGYARQDRKSGPRTPISAKLVANLITVAGADRVLTLDLHAGQIQGFFDIPTDNLYRRAGAGQGHPGALSPAGDLVIVSPDVGGVVRARAIATPARRRSGDHRQAPRAGRRLRGDEHHRRRRRPALHPGRRHRRQRRHAVQRRRGADGGAAPKSVIAYVTHGVLSGGAVARVSASPIESAGHRPTASSRPRRCGCRTTIRQLTIAPLIAEAIRRISEERSVSSLFD